MAIWGVIEHPAIYGLIEVFISISDVRMNRLTLLLSVHRRLIFEFLPGIRRWD